jgi:hypothetical protein
MGLLQLEVETAGDAGPGQGEHIGISFSHGNPTLPENVA